MRVWFNHWFSTCYHLIDLIRAGDPGRFHFPGLQQLVKLLCQQEEDAERRLL